MKFVGRLVLGAVLVVAIEAGLFDLGVEKRNADDKNHSAKQAKATTKAPSSKHLKGLRSNPNAALIKQKLDAFKEANKKSLMEHLFTAKKPTIHEIHHKVQRQHLGPKPINIPKLNEDLRDLLYEGDIVLSEDQFNDDSSPNKRGKRQTLLEPAGGTTWKNNLPIPYFFNPVFNSSIRAIIKDAVNLWQDNTCLSFKEINASDAVAPYVEFIQDSGCYSYIGMHPYGQPISIGIGCEHFGIIAHEIDHAIGVWHEHMRYDRDNYVTIDYSNVIANEAGNFAAEDQVHTTNLNTNYDYGSVMHYSEESWAIDTSKPTIYTKDPAYQSTMGQRTAPSFKDVLLVNRLYDCLGKCPMNITCQNDGYQNPKKCDQCICPWGFAGQFCEDRDPGSNDCGATVQATCEWQNLTGSGGVNDNVLYNFHKFCWWFIESPPGTQIEIQYFQAGGYCSDGCFYGEIETKLGNFSNSGYRYCCPDDLPKNNLISDGNLTIIGAGSRFDLQTFTLAYRIYNQTCPTTTMAPTTVPTTTIKPKESSEEEDDDDDDTCGGCYDDDDIEDECGCSKNRTKKCGCCH